MITLNQSENTEDCDLFVKADIRPTRSVYDYRNISMNAISSIVINNPMGTVYYIGIDGFRNCNYDLIVQENAVCPNNCNNHGTCNSNGDCNFSIYKFSFLFYFYFLYFLFFIFILYCFILFYFLFFISFFIFYHQNN